MMDRTTKLLLFAIAIGLWAHLLGWGESAQAQSPSVDWSLQQIANGTCDNRKICGQ